MNVRSLYACASALVLLSACTASSTARACASCGCGDPTITGMGVEKPYKNRVRLSLEERFGGHTAGTGDESDATWTLRSSLFASWSPDSRFTVLAMAPLVATWIQTRSQPWQNATGLGDAEVSGRGVMFRDRSFSPRHLLSGLIGLKIPTGPRLHDDAGYPFAEDDQPGSGSWDPFAGLSYGYFGEKISVFSSGSYRYTTTGRRGYKHGQSVGGTAGVQFQPIGVVALSLAADFRWAAADRLPGGIDAPNTGGAMLALTPAITIAPVERWLIRLAVQIHVADWLYGNQTESHAVMLSTVVDLN